MIDIYFDKDNDYRMYINGFDTRISCDYFIKDDVVYFEVTDPAPFISDYGEEDIVIVGFYVYKEEREFGSVYIVAVDKRGEERDLSPQDFETMCKYHSDLDEDIIKTLVKLFTSEEGQTRIANAIFG